MGHAQSANVRGNNFLILYQALIILLFIYSVFSLSLALIKGKDYLLTFVDDKVASELFFHSQNFTVALSALSITALALFIGLNPNPIGLAQFSPIILFFSISFVTLALAWNVVRFPKVIYYYISEILADIGILSIACGFLVFFYYRLPLLNELTLPFFVFIAFFLVLSTVNLQKYYKYWSNLKRNKQKLNKVHPVN